MLGSKVRAVYFDAVGTLLFPAVPVSQTYRTIAAKHGIQLADDEVRERLRTSFQQQEEYDRDRRWQTNEARELARWRAIVAAVVAVPDSEACFQELWHWYSTPAAWTVHPETTDVLHALAARGVVVGMASNLDRRLTPLVEAFPPLAPLRARCLISAHVGWRKPAAEFFAAVQASAGCSPTEIAFVGDDPHNDYAGANAAGMRALLLAPDGADVPHVRTLRDLVGA